MTSAVPKTAILCFSRTGHSLRLAERLAQSLDAVILPVSAPSYGAGILGYMRAGYHSIRERISLSPQSFEDLDQFTRVVVCGPVWTSFPACPIRALLRSDLLPSQTIGLFLTSGNPAPAKKAFDVATQDLGRPFCAMRSIGNEAEGTAQEASAIAGFIEEFEAKHPSADAC